MEKFLKFTNEKRYSSKTIDAKCIQEIDTPTIQIFNTIREKYSLYPNIRYISIRELINISPLCDKNKNLNPIVSFRFIYLIITIACEKISFEEDLEEGMCDYIIFIFNKFISDVDLTIPFALPFISAVFISIFRLSRAKTFILKETVSFERILFFLENQNQNIGEPIKLSDFPEPEILYFCLSVDIGQVNQNNIFGDINFVLTISIFKYLTISLQYFKPNDDLSFKIAIQKFTSSPLTRKYANEILILLFDNNEKEAISFSVFIQLQNYFKAITKVANDTNNFKNPIPYFQSITFNMNLQEILKRANEYPNIFIEFINKNNDFINIIKNISLSNYGINFILLSLQIMQIGNVQCDDNAKFIKMLFNNEDNKTFEVVESYLLKQKISYSDIQPFLKYLKYCYKRIFNFLFKLNSSKITTKYIKLCEVKINQFNEFDELYVNYLSYLEPYACPCLYYEKEFQKFDLNDLLILEEFNDNCLYIKLNFVLLIDSILLYIQNHENNIPKTIKIFAANIKINERSEFLSDEIKWNHICDVDLSEDQIKVKSKVFVPINCLKIVLNENYEINKRNKNIFNKTKYFNSIFSHTKFIIKGKLYYEITNNNELDEAIETYNSLQNEIQKHLSYRKEIKAKIEQNINSKENLLEIKQQNIIPNHKIIESLIHQIITIKKSIEQFQKHPNLELVEYPNCLNCKKLFIKYCVKYLIKTKTENINEVILKLIYNNELYKVTSKYLIEYFKYHSNKIELLLNEIDKTNFNKNVLNLLIETLQIQDEYQVNRIRKMFLFLNTLTNFHILDKFEQIFTIIFNTSLVNDNLNELELSTKIINYLLFETNSQNVKDNFISFYKLMCVKSFVFYIKYIFVLMNSVDISKIPIVLSLIPENMLKDTISNGILIKIINYLENEINSFIESQKFFIPKLDQSQNLVIIYDYLKSLFDNENNVSLLENRILNEMIKINDLIKKNVIIMTEELDNICNIITDINSKCSNKIDEN